MREWCFKEVGAGRATRGGAWTDDAFHAGWIIQKDPFDRDPTHGFRLVRTFDDAATLARLRQPAAATGWRDYRNEKPGLTTLKSIDDDGFVMSLDFLVRGGRAVAVPIFVTGATTTGDGIGLLAYRDLQTEWVKDLSRRRSIGWIAIWSRCANLSPLRYFEGRHEGFTSKPTERRGGIDQTGI